MFVRYKKFFLPILTLIIIFICTIYSLGFFDQYFMKKVNEKNYKLGNFLYTGTILNGKFQDEGIIIFLDSDSVYKGSFKDGYFNGPFTYISQNGWSLRGIFENGYVLDCELLTNNDKILINKNSYKSNKGWSYIGDLNKTGQNGKGIFNYADGNKYEGYFSHGLATESGTFCDKDGTIKYQGNLLNGLFNGLGKYSFNSTEYVGNFMNGLPDGRGLYKNKSGWIYEGNFNFGVFNGMGTLTYNSGEKVNGTWEKGRRVT